MQGVDRFEREDAAAGRADMVAGGHRTVAAAGQGTGTGDVGAFAGELDEECLHRGASCFDMAPEIEVVFEGIGCERDGTESDGVDFVAFAGFSLLLQVVADQDALMPFHAAKGGAGFDVPSGFGP